MATAALAPSERFRIGVRDMVTLLCRRLGMSSSVACHCTHLPETLNAGRDRRHARSSHEPAKRPRLHRYALNARSKKPTNARALAVAARPVGSTAHRSSGGRLHSDRTVRTAPDRSSGVNIHSDAMVRPAWASTAALTPSAAVTRNLLSTLIAASELSRRNDHTLPSPCR